MEIGSSGFSGYKLPCNRQGPLISAEGNYANFTPDWSMDLWIRS